MKHSRALIIGALGVCLLVLGLFVLRYWAVGRETQREILAVYRLVSLGDGLTELESVMATNKFARLRVKEVSQNQVAVIPSAVTRFANDWGLFLTLEDSKISGMQIRMLEGQAYHPEDAPPDKVRTTDP